MASFIKLKNTPIKEIIFTISFKENIELEKLEIFKKAPKIAENFPLVNKGFNTQIEAKLNQVPTSNVSTDGYIFRSKSAEPYLIQARRGSFSFHKVNGYESFESLINELKTYWDILIQSCGQLTIVNLSVRYLNFIEKNTEENINDLITINTVHPFGKKIDTNFTQHKFIYDKNPEIIVNVITAIGKNGDKDGVILDVILNKKIEIKKDEVFDFNTYTDLRTAKNDIFFKSITEKTINKYNQ